MLITRTMVHQLRPLLQPVKTRPLLRRLAAESESLSKKQPQKITGRHIFFRHLLSQAASGSKTGKLTDEQRREIVKHHGQLYKHMPMHDKLFFENEALAQQHQQQHLQQESQAAIRTQLDLHAKCEAAESQQHPLPCLLSSCRLSPESVDKIHENLQTLAVRKVLMEQRPLILEAPQAPSIADQDKLSEHDHLGFHREFPNSCPSWAAAICRNRDSFHDSIIMIRDGEGWIAWLIVFALKSPFLLVLAPLQRVTLELLASSGPMPVEVHAMLLDAPWLFEWKVGDYCDHSEVIEVVDVNAVVVLPHVAFAAANFFSSHASPLSLQSVVGAPEMEKARAKIADASSSRKRPISDDDLTKFPWLERYMPVASTSTSASASSAATATQAEPVSEDVVANAYDELCKARAEWNQSHGESAGSHFRIEVRGANG